MVEGQLIPTRVNDLVKSEFKFYLTGSRYFGNVTATSDWDFFVQDSNEVRDFLDRNGFMTRKGLEESTYVDEFLTVLYWAYSENNEQIHVQVIEHCEWKVKTQEFLKQFPWDLVEKNKRDGVWNWAKYRVPYEIKPKRKSA